MGVFIEELRIRNYKCYESADVKLQNSTLLLGANNVGKTSLLEALELCFTPYKKISEELIFLKKDEVLSREKSILLDVLISPIGDSFDDTWHEFFGDFVVEGESKDFVALRTIIKYSAAKGEYELDRKALNAWPESDDVVSFTDFNSHSVKREVIEAIPVFYLDAKRDIVSEMNDRFSYWGKLVKDIKLSDDDLKDMEILLNDINDQIIGNSDVLKHLRDKLNDISKVVNSSNNRVEINPVSRKIKDLDKGMEVRFSDSHSESFAISNQGMGTRSWTAFLTLSAYIEWKIIDMEREGRPYHPLLLLEEPEAHLHPQAQRKIYRQMQELTGQKVISTHSPIIAAQVNLDEIVHIYKKGESSSINYINLEGLGDTDVRKIKEEVIKTRGDILFADTLILCEGETEDQVLPEFFKEYYGLEPFELGTNILGVGGAGKYKPFMRVAKALDIELFIFSDGESRIVSDVKKHYKQVYGDVSDAKIADYITFLPDHGDFEKYLVQSGYKNELLKVIDEVKGKESFIEDYIERNNGQSGKPQRTEEVCPRCTQNIFKSEIKDYEGEEGFNTALIECLGSIKTEYSSQIGQLILQRDNIDKIPQVIRNFFFKIAKIKKYPINAAFGEIKDGGIYVEFDTETTRDS
ncbi:ATP-dependent nuclease [Sporosarcina koreensis]|uniref:ATP-dependent nuclease n=1 Tax=Sporosarcina koreensis TaxID=334735 RepID=UPI0009EA8F31|nr:AAA family ATPase [Sporosarcina koreensis]